MARRSESADFPHSPVEKLVKGHVAELSHRFVEAPSIRLGRFIANRLGGATALQPFAKSA